MYSSSTTTMSERSRRSSLDSTVVDFSPDMDTESDPLLPLRLTKSFDNHGPYHSIATANSCPRSMSPVSTSQQQSRSQPFLSSQTRQRINRKTDVFLLPLLSILYLFNGLDRGNVGNAQTQGFTTDIGCKPGDLNLAISAFWFMFVACQPVSAALGRRWGGRRWIVGIMLGWGALTLSQTFIKGRGALITTRLLIGAFEAGFYPTALAYLTAFYPPFDLAVRIALFYGQYAVAGAFSGAIAYAIFRIEHPTLKSWQLLFLIEGGATCLVALFAWSWLPEGPESAWFLTADERAFFKRRLLGDREGAKGWTAENSDDDDDDDELGFRKMSGRCYDGVDDTENQRMLAVPSCHGEADEGEGKTTARLVTWQEVVETVRDWKLWWLLGCNICASVPSTAFSVFLPLVVEGMGYSALQANLMSVPPFVFGALGVYLFALSSDRRRERGYHIMAGLAISAVGLAGILLTTSPVGKYVALCVLLFGSYVPPPLTAAWLSNNTRSPNKRALVLGVNGWGNLAGVIGSWVFRIGGQDEEKKMPGDEFRKPLLVTLGFVGMATMGYWAYREVLRRENNRTVEAEVGKMAEDESSRKKDNENGFLDARTRPFLGGFLVDLVDRILETWKF
ncbi:major facilitator superfamily domain-containing protein [Sordaria brevicollis]|uniref:Major facilitator superfamily domain-containing protein n=1 Tax=Sordaria brevicollis TaxID=83679 RepID=A0AAE0PLW9_SORBR|nr:major facilitator superfamily domain-containing protein [Sordaria brevicollis]